MRPTIITTAALVALPGALAAAECVGQGVGSCQFVMESWTDIAGNGGFPVTIYNHACEEIGYVESVDVDEAIDSQLPWTVDVIERGLIYAVFKYGAGTYGYGYSSYVTGSCSEGLVGCDWFRSAFPCPGF